jgi:hypothetical protein
LFASLGCSFAKAEPTSDHLLAIYRVKEKPSQEGMVRIEKQELGCDSCEEVEFDELPGTRATFLMNPEPAVFIDVSDIKELLIIRNSVSEREFVFQLSAHLTPDAAAKFDVTRRPLFSLGLVLFRGEKLGIGPLVAPGGLLQIGIFATQADAEGVGRKLGLEPKVIRSAE